MRAFVIAAIVLGLPTIGAHSQAPPAPVSQPEATARPAEGQDKKHDPQVVNARIIEVLRKFGCQTDLKPAQHDGIQAALDLVAATHAGQPGVVHFKLLQATETGYASWLEWMIENGARACTKLTAASPGSLRLPPRDLPAKPADRPPLDAKAPNEAVSPEFKKAAIEPPKAAARKMPSRPRMEADKGRRGEKGASSATSGLPRCTNWNSGPGAPSCIGRGGRVCWNAYGRMVCN